MNPRALPCRTPATTLVQDVFRRKVVVPQECRDAQRERDQCADCEVRRDSQLRGLVSESIRPEDHPECQTHTIWAGNLGITPPNSFTVAPLLSVFASGTMRK